MNPLAAAAAVLCGHNPDELRRSKKPKRGAVTFDALAKLRCWQSEKEAWTQAAGLAGYLSLSDWIRDTLNATARRARFTSSAIDTYNTPEDFLEDFRELGPIGLDPCSNEGSIVGAVTEWRLERDGDSLLRSWLGFGLWFVNPPYGGALPAWIAKCDEQAAEGGEGFGLVPARTDTQWFDLMLERADVALLRGRLTFKGAANSALFPCAVPYWGPRRELFARVAAPHSTIILPRRCAA